MARGRQLDLIIGGPGSPRVGPQILRGPRYEGEPTGPSISRRRSGRLGRTLGLAGALRGDRRNRALGLGLTLNHSFRLGLSTLDLNWRLSFGDGRPFGRFAG